jgi:hypothetical protein
MDFYACHLLFLSWGLLMKGCPDLQAAATGCAVGAGRFWLLIVLMRSSTNRWVVVLAFLKHLLLDLGPKLVSRKPAGLREFFQKSGQLLARFPRIAGVFRYRLRRR